MIDAQQQDWEAAMYRLEIPAAAVDFCLSILPKYAPLFNAARFCVEATPYFHIMCDSLAWSDELPDPHAVPTEGKRLFIFLLQVRTATLFGRNNEECDRLISAIEPLVSDWAYFHESRWDSSLCKLFTDLAGKVDEEFQAYEEKSRREWAGE